MWLLAFVCLSASTVFSLVIPKMLGNGIDTVLNSGRAATLIIAAGIILGSSTLRGYYRVRQPVFYPGNFPTCGL